MSRTFVFCVDVTKSMAEFSASARSAIVEMARMIKVFPGMKIGLVVYRDYHQYLDACDVIEPTDDPEEIEKMISLLFCTNIPNGDTAEASKTGLYNASLFCNSTTVVFHYTDAMPHHKIGRNFSCRSNYCKEEAALSDNFGWWSICQRFRNSRTPVFTFTNKATNLDVGPFYIMLGELSSGGCVPLSRSPTREEIYTTTMNVFFSLVGQNDEETRMLRYTKKTGEMATIAPKTLLSRKTDDLSGVLPGGKYIRIKEFSIHVKPKFDLGDVIAEYAISPKFRDDVHNLFSALVDGHHTIQLTVNPIYGKMWRAICNSTYPASKQIVGKISTRVSQLNEPNKSVMKKWIDESYDQTPRINEIIADANKHGGVFVYEGTKILTKKEIMDLGRGFSAEIARMMVSLLSKIRYVKRRDLGNIGNVRYVPIDTNQLFYILPHLFSPGVMFSKRAAAAMALVTMKSGIGSLMHMASRFLVGEKGTWMTPDKTEPRPENYSASFAHFTAGMNTNKFFTQEESRLLKAIRTVSGYNKALHHTVPVDSGIRIPESGGTGKNDGDWAVKLRDHKVICKHCKQWRSQTLMLRNGKCAGCRYHHKTVDSDSENSYMMECYSCTRLYAILDAKEFNNDKNKAFIRPKCHSCRTKSGLARGPKNAGSFSTTCTKCNTPYCSDDKNEFKECKFCVSGGKCNIETVPVHKLWVHPSKFGIPNCVTVSTATTRAPSMWSQREAIDYMSVTKDVYHPDPIKYNKRRVNNDVYKEVQMLIKKNNPKFHECMLCYDEFTVSKCGTACGRDKCQVICNDCADQVYTAKPGHIVSINQLQCPFCRRPPTFKKMYQHNRESCAMKRSDGRSVNGKHGGTEFDPGFYMGFCTDCYKCKPAIARTCASTAPEIDNFRCEECVKIIVDRGQANLEAAEDSDAKNCPSSECNIPVIKLSGCDHITCQCGAHWCWRCRTEFPTSDACYKHMFSGCKAGKGYGFTQAEAREWVPEAGVAY